MWTYRPTDSAPYEKEPRTTIPKATASSLRQSEPDFRRQSEGPRLQPARTERSQTDAGAGLTQKESAQQPVWDMSGKQSDALRLRAAYRPKSRRTLRSACVMGVLYLAGLTAGSLCTQALREPLLTYARYFASIDLGLRTTGNGAMVFSVGFLSLFCQLTLLFIAGFCVLGVGLIPVTMLLKGAGTGIFTALLYQQLGPAKGLLLQGLVFWLPETLGTLLVIALSVSALQVSCGLLRCCLGQGGAGLGAASRRLLRRYLTINLVSMLVCGLSVVLTLVFGGLF